MSLKTLAIFSVLLTVVRFAHSIDYCAPAITTACGGKPHIGCNNPGVPVSPTCLKFAAVTFTDSQKSLFLAAHNEKRNLVASGNAKNTSAIAQAFELPSATNMKLLTWNSEAAYLAGLNTLQCKMSHDKCRSTNVYNGQNLYISMQSSPTPVAVETVIKAAVDTWYNEINKLDLPQINSFTGANGVGHFTQVIWAKTSQIGCGMSSWYDGTKWYNYLVACNYAPGGNYLGSPIYTVGKPASACTSGISTTYSSLCL